MDSEKLAALRAKYGGAKGSDIFHPPFAEVVETRGGVVAVTRDRKVFGGGAYDGMIETDMINVVRIPTRHRLHMGSYLPDFS